jgi:collagen triple helix repeat protein
MIWKSRIVLASACLAVLILAATTPVSAQAVGNTLGDPDRDLSFTPVAPCRIIDTRLIGPQPGPGDPLVPGTPRDFVVVGTAGFPEQGGTAGGCGIPAGVGAVEMNIVAADATDRGNLAAFPWSATPPALGTFSTINFAAAATTGNRTNAIAQPICNTATGDTCTFDLTVQTRVTSVQLVIDVVGYYTAATAPAGPTGPQGPTGADGATGPQGPEGATGPQGLAGPAGATGATGPAGATGAGAIWRDAWDNATAYVVGDMVQFGGSSYIAVADNTGQQPDITPADWNLVAQAGATGPQGPTGPDGATGPQGLTGLEGPSGPSGPSGPEGPSGPQGLSGTSGSLIGGNVTNPENGDFLTPWGSASSVFEASNSSPVSSGTASKLEVALPGNAVSTITVTIRKDGADTALTCTILAGNSTCADLAHSVTFTDGQMLSVGYAEATAQVLRVKWSILYTAP